MATDDLDPVQSQRRANDQLRVAMLQLDEHIQALTAPTMELALIQKKRAANVGLEEREPSDLLKKFISQAGPGAKIGTSGPGQLNPEASEGPRGGPLQYQTGQEQAPLPTLPHRRGEAPSIVPGVGENELEAMQDEQLVIPQYGQFKIDAYLRMARRAAARKAEPEPGTGEPNKWASVAGGLNTAIEKVPEIAAAYQAGKSYIKPMLDIGFGASSMGTSLGYTPQAGGGVLGASHILGIPNPIAAFTSPAGKQGLGTLVNAAEAAIGGTGIGLGEANQLRQELAQKGWSNQRSGGMLGFTVGGQQENLATTLEPLVKMGFNSPTSIQQLGSWTNALKLGQASPEDLKKTLEQLPEAAKVLHKTLEEVTQGMEEFSAKAVQGGSTMIHGAHAYNEIWKNTGLNPVMTQQANEGTFGKVQAAQKGVLPWQIASMTGNQASTNAYAAVKQLADIAGPGAAVKTTNKYGETEEISAKDAKLAMMHQLEPNMTTEYMQRMLEVGPHMEAAASGMHKADQLTAFIKQKQHENQAYGPHVHEAVQHEHEWHREAAWQQKIEANLKKNPGDAAEEINLATAKKNAQDKYHAMIAAKGKAADEGHLNATQEGHVIAGIYGKGGLEQRAKEAGLEKHGELSQWRKMDPAQAATAINAALAKVAEVKPEKTEEGKAEIVLNPDAKKWFSLQFPNAKAPKEVAGEGGKSTASQAAQPNAGESAANASLMRQYQQSRRNEPTTAG